MVWHIDRRTYGISEGNQMTFMPGVGILGIMGKCGDEEGLHGQWVCRAMVGVVRRMESGKGFRLNGVI